MKRNKREKRLAEVGGFDGQALANKFACVDDYKYASFRDFNLVGKPHDIWQIIVEAPIVDIYIYRLFVEATVLLLQSFFAIN